MKNTIIIVLLASLCATQALASSKICFGSTKNDETKGLIMAVDIESDSISMKPVKGLTYDGTFKIINEVVHARDGKTYIQYLGEDGDQQDYIMVDQMLLNKGTTGLLQIRSRGEGYFNSVFVCKDAVK